MQPKTWDKLSVILKCMFVSIINDVEKIYGINELKYFDRAERHDF